MSDTRNAYERMLDRPEVQKMAAEIAAMEKPIWADQWPPDPRVFTGMDNYKYAHEREFQAAIKYKYLPQIKGGWSIQNYKVADANTDEVNLCGQLGYVDFACLSQKWFVECKMEATAQELAHGLGQCLFYQHFLPSFRGFLVIPSNHIGEIDTFQKVCWKHNIVLCTEGRLVDEILRANHSLPPGFI